MTKEVKIMIGIAVVVLGGGIALLLAQPEQAEVSQPVDEQSLVREGSHMTGKKEAKVTMVEFGDFQCPACGAAHPIIKQVLADYKDNPEVNFVFRNFPLTSIHPNALASAEAAEAAGEQGKYWEMHDMLYQKQNEWSSLPNPVDTFVGYAGQLGLNTDQFRQSVVNEKYSSVIDADLADGGGLGVNSTPTLYINGKKLASYQYDSMKAAIEEALKQ